MAIPDYQSLMLPLLELLSDGRIHSMREIFELLESSFQLSPEERLERVPSGRETKIRNRASWARTYLKKAGLVSSPERGKVRITPEGAELLRQKPERIDNAFLGSYESFADFRPQNSSKESPLESQSPASDRTPEEEIGEAHRILNASLAVELLDAVFEASPMFFEKLVINLMLSMGYGGNLKGAGRSTPYTNDNGIDGIINEDKLGLDKIYLQAKRWRGTIDRPEIDRFIGALTRLGARKGVFITTSTFSEGAKLAAEGLNISIVLIDGEDLAKLMIEHNVGVQNKDVFIVKQMDSDFFSED